ncbi:histidinol-phosphate transaminase [Brevibacillus sp. SYSU BS000544]|uniref:histidinol-phosphate transaminase n=1 Tax=Brevibacillus sp. SYSU BS000544 TaxID=3416443 RepID=UPI003CE4FAB8
MLDTVQARSAIVALPPQFPGLADVPIQDIKQMVGLKEVYKLSCNENPSGPSPKAITAMTEVIGSMNLYPDATARALRGMIGRKVNLDPRHVVLSTGAEGGFQLVAETFLEAGDEVIIPELTTNWYKRFTLSMGAVPIMVPLAEMSIDFSAIRERVTEQTKIIVLPNPFDPTGTYFTEVQLTRFLESLPSSVIVAVDESYGEYATAADYSSAASLVEKHPQILVIRTFSKAYGLAGARIGYLVTSLDIVGFINRIRTPYQISSVAQAGALASLQDEEYLKKCVEWNERGKQYLYEQLKELNITYTPSQANFVLLDTGRNASELFNLLARKGVVVRTVEGAPTFLRVSVGTQEALEHFVAAMKDLL